MLNKIIAFILVTSGVAFSTTKSVYRVWQPISLHGTDVSSVQGKESGVDYTVLMSRPVVLSGALPEDLVYAVALKHQLASIGGYSVKEANLMSLSKIKLHAQLTDDVLLVSLDISGAKVPKDVDVSLYNVVKLSIDALKMTLEDYTAAYLQEGMSCAILVTSDQKGPQLEKLKKLDVRFVANKEN
ncbi:MAG: hypothetical protein ABGY95_02965 [Rubritalea sp.]|uniref:hypothetical protein n=1 Tax=Rubritalea sp. TaxID=2109375 RepID=UPI0032423879